MPGVHLVFTHHWNMFVYNHPISFTMTFVSQIVLLVEGSAIYLHFPQKIRQSIHYNDVIMSSSQITSVSIVCSAVCLGVDQRKHKSSASPAFVRGIHRWSVDSPHKGPVTRKMFPFDDVIMKVLVAGLFGGIFIVDNRLHYSAVTWESWRPK